MEALQCHYYCQHIPIPHHYLAGLAVEVKKPLSMQEQQTVVQLQPGEKKSLDFLWTIQKNIINRRKCCN